jgi:hypothetical protein
MQPCPASYGPPARRSSGVVAELIADQTVLALLRELTAWPKPGLVSDVDSGNRTDMDAAIAAGQCCARGCNGRWAPDRCRVDRATADSCIPWRCGCPARESESSDRMPGQDEPDLRRIPRDGPLTHPVK